MMLGLLEFALALVSVPMLALLPQHLTSISMMSLGTVGLLLFSVRLIDACVDPWLGSRIVKVVHVQPKRAILVMLCLMLIATLALFLIWDGSVPFTHVSDETLAILGWFALLMVLYLSVTSMTLMYLEWHMSLSSQSDFQSKLVGYREAWGALGLLVASALSSQLNSYIWAFMFAAAALLGLIGLGSQRHLLIQKKWLHITTESPINSMIKGSVFTALKHQFFQRWLALYVVNGLATSASATLIVLFLQDVLNVKSTEQGLLLGLYFLTAICSIPFWIRTVQRLGWVKAWRASAWGVCIFFTPALFIQAGDVWMFATVCLLSGIFVGADFVIPGAWLAHRLGADNQTNVLNRGACLGWWQFLKKANLALSAGLLLPLLSYLGYVPGTLQQAGTALPVMYVVIPISLKMLSILMLSYFQFEDYEHAPTR